MDNLENLMTLKNDMKKKNWTICDFIFEFNGVEYIVLVNRFVGNTIRENKYAVVKLNFMKCENLKDELPVEASIKQLFIDAKTLREYFGIKYSENLGNILNQFTYRLGQSVPKTMPDMKTLTDFEKGAIVRSLSISDSEDPNKIYCIGVRRNPEGKFRSEFNSDKTKVLRKTLYDKFADDHSISFCYSADQTKEKRDEIIYKLFANE